MARPKAIVFDFNGLFVQAPEKKIIKKLCAFKGTGEWIALSNYYLNLWEFQLGKMNPFDFWKKVFVGLSEEEFFDVIVAEYDVYARKNEGLYSLAERLSKKFDLHVLSNSNFLQGKAYRKQKLFSPFKSFHLSHEMHEMKPFPEAFRLFLKETGLKAKECVFIDDSTVNVLAAMALGFKGIVFQGNDDLEKKLERLGIDV